MQALQSLFQWTLVLHKRSPRQLHPTLGVTTQYHLGLSRPKVCVGSSRMRGFALGVRVGKSHVLWKSLCLSGFHPRSATAAASALGREEHAGSGDSAEPAIGAKPIPAG